MDEQSMTLVPDTLSRVFCALLVIALFGALLVAAPLSGPVERVPPALLQVAHDQPALIVDLIIQKRNGSQALERQIENLGGTVLSEMPLINGLTVRIKAGAIPYLAQLHDIRWISLDAPRLGAACGGVSCGTYQLDAHGARTHA